MTFGQRLSQELRKMSAMYNKEEITKSLDISVNTFNKYLRDEITPSFQVLEGLQKLGMSISVLMGEEPMIKLTSQEEELIDVYRRASLRSQHKALNILIENNWEKVIDNTIQKEVKIDTVKSTNQSGGITTGNINTFKS